MALRWFGALYRRLNQWVKHPLLSLPHWITPNLVTVTRAMTFVPMAVLVLLGHNLVALVVHIVASILDFVDGALARARNESTELGAVMDAMSDKAYFAGSVGLLLPLMDYTGSPWWAIMSIVGAGSILVVIEAYLARVRWQDYDHNHNHAKDQGGKRDLRADHSGKFKFTLETIGIGAYIVAYPDPTSAWALLGLTTFALATPYAVKSLQSKLRQR
jgi:phosphatidylglycerophosphate synthase